MTATITTSTRTTTSRTAAASSRRSLVTAVAGSVALAAAATETLTAVVRASGVDLTVERSAGHAGTPIGLGACTIMLVLCMVPAVALIAGLRRWVSRQARAWYAITPVLVLASFVPDLTTPGTSVATRLTLMSAHVVAAAIIVPAVGRRLR